MPLFALPLRWFSNTSSQGRDRVCLTSITVRALHNSDGSIDGGHKAQRSTVGVVSRQCNAVAVGHCKTSPREGWAGMGVSLSKTTTGNVGPWAALTWGLQALDVPLRARHGDVEAALHHLGSLEEPGHTHLRRRNARLRRLE